MKTNIWISGCAVLAALLFAGCGANQATDGEGGQVDAAAEGSEEGPIVTVIEPGPNVQTEAQEALILADVGEVIEFAEGEFQFDGTLSLDGIENVTIRGRGMEKTILDFSGQQKGTGGEGLKITANQVTIEDLTIQDTPGDALKVEGADGVTIRRVRTWWTGGPKTENGAYGIYPVLCSDVLVEDSVAECASDAGVYVGQSERVIVRRCRAERNVAGIEIENVVGADVYENVATNNTGGMLVFSLPGLEVKNGRNCRIFNNDFFANNHENFALEGNIVATVPAGTGLMIMANDYVEVFDNRVHDHITANCAVVSFFSAQKKFDDPQYDPYPEAIYIHDNQFSGGGTDPQGPLGALFTLSADGPVPDVIYDGVVDENKAVDGQLPDELGIRISNNGDATFANFGFAKVMNGEAPEISADATPYTGTLTELPAISIPNVE